MITQTDITPKLRFIKEQLMVAGWAKASEILTFLQSYPRHLTTTYAGEGASVVARASLGPTHYKSKKINK